MEETFELTDEARVRARQAFEESGKSKNALCRETGISWGALDALFKNTKFFGKLPVFAKAVGVSVSYILTGDDTPSVVTPDSPQALIKALDNAYEMALAFDGSNVSEADRIAFVNELHKFRQCSWEKFGCEPTALAMAAEYMRLKSLAAEAEKQKK